MRLETSRSLKCYQPEPQKPQLIWRGRDKRKISEPLPSCYSP